MLLYAVTVFLSAFLLFQVQPMIGKCILPWFGSTPAVWTTCMLFFQSLLLVGYAYAHGTVTWLGRKQQGMLHVVLLLGACLLLPVNPQPPETLGSSNPTGQILLLLLVSVGAPYALLSSTGPLLQGWFAETFPGRSPYRLYALSNVGSLLALLTYPVVFETSMSLHAQRWSWSGGYMVFALLAAACAIRLITSRTTTSNPAATVERATSGAGEDAGPGAIAADHSPPTFFRIVLWLLLSMCGSVMLLAVTNQLCLDFSVIPFLWVLPFILYLFTFIIAFDSEQWYHRGAGFVLLLAGAGLIAGAVCWGVTAPFMFQLPMYALGLFGMCFAFHGELARAKPAPRYLTLYFLLISAGGALGGVFVAIAAPFLFGGGYLELHIGLGISCFVVFAAILADQERQLEAWRKAWNWDEPLDLPEGGKKKNKAAKKEAAPLPFWISSKPFRLGWLGLGAAVVGGMSYALARDIEKNRQDNLAIERDFFGVLRVAHSGREINKDGGVDETWHKHSLNHGRIMHGFQYQAANKKRWATSYYCPNSGVGVAIRRHPNRHTPDRQFRIGVVGLGTGTTAAYAGAGDYIRFYEINPHMEAVSGRFFSFRDDAKERGADVDVYLGDARMYMAQQLKRGERERFDVLAIDAFSGDSIPIHLLTRECFQIYLDHLAEGGILCIHVSNRYLDLKPVVRKLAAIYEREALWIDAVARKDDKGESADNLSHNSDWILVSRNEKFIQSVLASDKEDRLDDRNLSDPIGWMNEGTGREDYRPWSIEDRPPLEWTDDSSSVFSIIR